MRTSPPGELDWAPIASPALVDFLAHSAVCLLGRMDKRGNIAQANPALRRWLDSSGQGQISSALTDESASRFRTALVSLRRRGDRTALALEFGHDQAAPGVFRCMLQRGEGPDLWLFGEPAAETLDLHVELAALNRTLYQQTLNLERARADSESQARTDPLTGLANRRQGDSWLGDGVARAGPSGAPYSCAMIDLDDFKAINDTFGHPVGDRVLREAARLLAECGRPADRIIRLGGEEFLVLLPDTPLAGAIALAERMRRSLSGRTIPPLDRPLSASFGVACLRPGESADSLLTRADAALIVAKHRGRNRVEADE